MKSTLLMSLMLLGFSAAARPAAAAGLHVFIRHEVTDYAKWRKAYDDFGPTQKKMGVSAQSVYRSVDNPNEVTVTHDFASMETAKIFMDSPDSKAAMEKAGVAGAPKIWFTTSAESRSGETAGVRLFVHHEVTDYDAWRKDYDAFDATRRKLGVTAQAVYRSEGQPNDVTVTHDFKTIDRARAFAASKELKAVMEKAGVSGTPEIWFTTRAAK